MKRLFIVNIMCIFALVGFAQTTVKGQLTGPTEKDPLPYATISIFKKSAPKTAIKKLATSDKGVFSVQLPNGSYQFLMEFVGMDSSKKDVEISGNEKQIDLGKVLLKESTNELSEVSVVAQKPLVKVEVDKLTYSAKDDPESTTSSVLDLLRKVPLVTVDGEDKIQLKGNTNYKIYMNGKPSNMITSNPSQVLKSMPANSVKNIEVITDPGAKYDAEGVAGIINIIIDKRADDGFSGSVSANGDSYGGIGGGLYLALKYGKFGVTGNGNVYSHKNPWRTSTFERDDFAPNPVNRLTQDGENKGYGRGVYNSIDASYEIDTLNLINVSYSRYGGNFFSDSRTKAISSGARNYSYDMLGASNGEYGGMNVGADYQKSFYKKGELLTLSYRYEYNPNNSSFNNSYSNVIGNYFYPDGYQIDSENESSGKEHTTQIDYVNPFTKNHNVEVGLKYINRDNSSESHANYLDVTDNSWKDLPTYKNDLKHSQDIASGYFSYTFKKDKYSIKPGLRAEYTKQHINFVSQNIPAFDKNFMDWIPSIMFSYQLAMTKSIKFGYNNRISRPSIYFLSPYVDKSNPISISYGNPNLTSERTHTFEINYGSFSQKLNLNTTLSYNYTNNAITSYSFVKDDITNTTYDNIGKENSIGLSMYGSYTPTQRLRMMLNASTTYTDIRNNKNENMHNSGFAWRFFSNNTYTFPKDLRLSFSGGVFSQNVQLQSTMSMFYFYGISLMKSFFDKKLDVNLRANNMFNPNVKLKSTMDGEGFHQQSISYQPSQRVGLSLTYRFGNLKSSVKKVSRTISNDDLKSGGNQQGGNTGGGNM